MKNINRQNLKNLWNEWKILIDKIVPQNNKYYTLTNGINNELAQKQKVIKADIVIPNELIEFYKIYNVKSNSIFSVFSSFTSVYVCLSCPTTYTSSAFIVPC